MNEIRWGIIGCGDVTEVKSGPAFNKVPQSRLVAVMRRDAEKAADYARRHGVPRWYSKAEELIADPEVNAIYIATPPLYHESYCLEAIRAGKPVYLEKPMALDEAGARRMQAAAAAAGIKLSVAHYRRRQPLFLKVKSLLESGSIGDLRLVNLQLLQPHRSKLIAQTEVNWRLDPAISGGGLFHDLAPHQLDLMLYLFGHVQKAVGLAGNTGGYYPADDTVSGQLLFHNGVLFQGLWCFVSGPHEQRDLCEIIGTEGSIRFSIFSYKEIVLHRNGTEQIIPFEPLAHVQQPMIESVVQYFLGQGPNPCPAAEGAEVMRLMDAFTARH